MALAAAALKAGKQALDDYSHRNSPKKFTQPQLFAICVLRQFFKIGYRDIEQYLLDLSDLRQVLGLQKVPDSSTIYKAEQRILKKGAPPEPLTLWCNWPATAA